MGKEVTHFVIVVFFMTFLFIGLGSVLYNDQVKFDFAPEGEDPSTPGPDPSKLNWCKDTPVSKCECSLDTTYGQTFFSAPRLIDRDFDMDDMDYFCLSNLNSVNHPNVQDLINAAVDQCQIRRNHPGYQLPNCPVGHDEPAFFDDDQPKCKDNYAPFCSCTCEPASQLQVVGPTIESSLQYVDYDGDGEMDYKYAKIMCQFRWTVSQNENVSPKQCGCLKVLEG
jgi:hypothetical protein